MSYQKERESFIARISRECILNPAARKDEHGCTLPGFGEQAHIARAILRDAATHHRLAEVFCNEGGTKEQARRSDACERRITERCVLLGPGFKPLFSGDPRGATVKIRVPSGYSDSWGGEGLCVPVRS